MNQPTPKATNIWYKNYMVIVFVIGLPIFVLITCIFFIVFAIGIQDSTVRDDWYMDGKALYQDASKDQLTHDLGISGVMRFVGNDVRFELKYPKSALETGQFADGTPLYYPKTLDVGISHATDKTKDKDFVLTHQQDNIYTGTVVLDNDVPAKYYLQINTPKDTQKPWRLMHAQKLPAANVGFAPLPAFDKPSK